jgi:serine/threonine-protein kinase RsbW
VVRLNIPAQLCFRDLAHAAVLAALDAEDAGASSEVRDEIVSAISEAINNVVLHAYKDVRGGTIDLRVDARPGEVEIQISDRGKSFDPESVPSYVEPQLELDASGMLDFGHLPESGMGIFIMRSFMDEVTYVPGGGVKPNVLVLRKRWSAAKKTASYDPSYEPTSYEADSGRKEPSQSGWRMRSVAVPAYGLSIAGSLKRK